MKTLQRNFSVILHCRKLCFAAILLSAAVPAFGQTIWTGNTNSLWGTGTNWSTGTAPSSGTVQVIFKGDGTNNRSIDVGSNRNVGLLRFDAAPGVNGFTFTSTSQTTQLQIRPDGIVNNDGDAQTFNVRIRMFTVGGGPGGPSLFDAAAGNLIFAGNTADNTNGFAVDNNAGLLTVTGAFNTTIGTGSNGNGGILMGSGGLTKNGTGTLRLGGTSANTYSGITTLNMGTLELGKAGALGTGGLTIGGQNADAKEIRSTVALTGVNAVANNITVQSFFTVGGAQNIEFAGTMNLGGFARTITVTNTGLTTISGAISSTGGGLTKAGAGTLALGAANTYTGDTTINAGQLDINATSTLGNGSGQLNLSGGRLNTTANRAVVAGAVANPIHLTANSEITTTDTTGTVHLNMTGALSGTGGTLTFRNASDSTTNVFAPRLSAGGFTFDRPIVLANGSNGGKTELYLFNLENTEQVFTGIISGTGSIRRSIPSGIGGNTIFTAANTYSGGTVLNSGLIGFGRDSAGPVSALTSGPIGTGALTIGQSPTVGFFAHGAARTVGNDITVDTSLLKITGEHDLTLSGAVSLSAGTRNFEVTNTGLTTVSGEMSGAGDFVKSGAGRLLLSEDATFTGTASIEGGTLEVGKSIASAVTLGSNGRLAGSGSLGGLTWTSGGEIALQLGLSSFALTGALAPAAPGGNYVFDFLESGSIGQTYSLMSFASTAFSPTDFGYSNLNNQATGGTFAIADNQLYFTVIPEPSTYAAIFGGLALLGAFVYRRRMSAKK